MRYNIRAVTRKDHGTVRKLHQQTFGGTAEMVNPTQGWWWIVWDGLRPVAFAGMVKDTWGPGRGYFARAGVLKSYRGNGLQLRLLKSREKKARTLGWGAVVTDTTDNPWSEANLQKAGFTPYIPRVPWGMPTTNYWIKCLG